MNNKPTMNYKAETYNNMGFVFLTLSPLTEDFLKNEALPEKTVIEIGAGFNNLPIEALKRNIGKYIANDISEEHLNILKAKAYTEIGDGHNLQLLASRAPEQLPKVKNEYDAILIDKVMHFFKPNEIKLFIEWAYKSLKANGRIYVSVITPFGKTFNPSFLATYNKKKLKNEEFPGHFENIYEYIEPDLHSNINLPKEMVAFDQDNLCSLFENNGFKIIRTYNMKLPTEECLNWKAKNEQESTFIGILAEKI